jgi:LysR family hydrogen peroxide-inducible transcriptional activator
MLIHTWPRQNSMDMHAIRYFLVACEERSFTRAAKRCRVAQPSVSNAIQRLEKELGGSLFVRAVTGVQLTALGRAVRPHLARIDGLADVVRKTFSSGPIAGGVRSGRRSRA